MAADAPGVHPLVELANYRMPFGKYEGTRLVDLPEAYVLWFSRQGYPRGKLGDLMKAVYEIKVNGLEYLLDPLVAPDGGPSNPVEEEYPVPSKEHPTSK